MRAQRSREAESTGVRFDSPWPVVLGLGSWLRFDITDSAVGPKPRQDEMPGDGEEDDLMYQET